MLVAVGRLQLLERVQVVCWVYGWRDWSVKIGRNWIRCGFYQVALRDSCQRLHYIAMIYWSMLVATFLRKRYYEKNQAVFLIKQIPTYYVYQNFIQKNALSILVEVKVALLSFYYLWSMPQYRLCACILSIYLCDREMLLARLCCFYFDDIYWSGYNTTFGQGYTYLTLLLSVSNSPLMDVE